MTSTKACSQPGRLSVGTNTLLPNDNGRTSRNITPCTAPEVRTFKPTNTETQQKQSAKPIETATAASSSTGPVCTRKPSSVPKPRKNAQSTT